jgi:Zn-dependent M16 (insulinase) family peptidase
MYLITYRDPNVQKTFDVYATLGDEIEKMELNQGAVDGFIMSVYFRSGPAARRADRRRQ